MDISIRSKASQSGDTDNVSFDELGVSFGEWMSFDNEKKTEIIQNYIIEKERPYWVLVDFCEINE